ncbi:MAG: TonB-dependent receptor [Bryobacteraceae bacterium]|nr:carboxypeptidase regulatory-like domain-containing protein [Bryobacterales bacterium]MEB2361229.1 carboxypeptidase regulatory-like domain-containing protein [Bryobacterales bacterium]NUN01076.1 TonB-dependent receptor [Bryobacteraceae bacterium]
MQVRLMFFAVGILVLIGLLTPSMHAQVLYGSVVGTVQDQSGAVIPGANVTLTSAGTGQTREITTDNAGRFSVPNLVPGSYELRVAAQGFRPFVQTNVAATPNNVTRVDVKLELGATTEQVTVSAAAALLQTDKADVHMEIGAKEVTSLPLGGYRNYQSLIDLVPGATPSTTQNSIQGAPARALTTNINGTNRNNNITRLDGAVNLYIWLPHHTAYVAPSETVETVSIATNNFDAEQGMAGGAAVTVVTKSGTNEMHGSVFAYHTNNHLAAKNFFFAGNRLPKNTRNMDGFTLGGPIVKNKLFFFGGWEGMRERVSSSNLYTLATAAQRAGDFSTFPTTIYDPATGTPDGRGRTPFANNIVPLNRQSAITRKMQALAPEPNLSGTASNYFKDGTQIFDRDNFDVKVNWNRSDSHALFAKYSAMNANPQCNFALGEAGGPAACSGSAPGKAHTLTQISTIGHTWTFSPRFVMDGTLGWTRMKQDATNPDYGTNFGLDVLGIPGTNGPDIRQSGMPNFSISGYTAMGNGDNPRPNFYADQSYTSSHNASLTMGAHELRFGFDVVRHQLNHWQPELNNPRGVFAFGGAETALNGGAAPNQFNSYAAFLLGLPNGMGKSLQYLTMTGREWQFGWYARDRWQVTPHLTLSLGLRYEYYPLMTRADRGLERYDPETNQVIIGRRGGNPDNVGITVSKKLFAPRVGFAYRLGTSTVIRSGYGITYDPLPFSRPLRGPYPATIDQRFNGDNSFLPYRPIELGIPEFSGPDINSGFIALPSTVANRSPWGGRLNRGYIQSWNFIVERKLPSQFITTFGYVGTQTVHALADRNINAAAPGRGNSGRPLNATLGRAVDTNMWDGFLNANYHALQVSFNRQFSGGFQMKGAYTFSKAINATDEDGWASVGWNYPDVMHRNRALAGYDRTHILQAAFIFEPPFGPGKAFLQDGFVSQILRNWQLSSIFSSYTGTPFTVSASGASLNAPGNSQTADQVKPEVEKFGGVGRNVPFYDPLAFRSVTTVRFGSTGRNILRGPGVVNADISLSRFFPLTERFRLQLRAEGFNITNTPHFNNPGANVSNMSVTPGGTITNLGNFMSITGARADERVFRFALRLEF